jgi:hypothetical protein
VKTPAIAAACLVLTACSGPQTEWIGVVDSSVAPPYADFASPSGTYKTLAECEQAMKAAAGEQKEKPAAREGVVVRTLFYRCREGKEGKSEKLVATKYLALPEKP